MNSLISEMPGPEVAVKARAPFQPAPTTMPMEASSSSACTIAKRFWPVAGSTRNLRAVLLERLGHRGRGRDRIPGRDRRAAVHAAQRRGAVAVDEDAVAHPVGAPHLQPERLAAQVLAREVAAQVQRLDVGGQQLFLALVLLAEQLLDHFGLDAQQHGQRADVDDVLEQLALARVVVDRVADLGQRHADHVDVVAELRRRQRPRAVVEQVAAGLELGHVGIPGLRVHRHHHVDAAAPAQVAALASRAPRTRSAGPGCCSGRCCAGSPARPCAGWPWRTARWPRPSPSR